jgi:Glycosyltransferase family 29 (sialyltransferase)
VLPEQVRQHKKFMSKEQSAFAVSHQAERPATPRDRGPAAPGRFDQFDFRNMFAGVRSVAIVGNAATVLEFNNGELIDGYDMVVRFNRAQTTGLESKIGRRTDLLVANENNRLELAPSPAETLKPRCVLSFVLREPGFDIAPFRRWVGDDIPTLCAVPPDIIGFEQTGRTRLLTQGTYALYFLLNSIRIERLFLTGFTMFGAGPGGAQKYYEPKERRRAPGNYHDLDQEPKLWCDILASFRGELRVTEEVSGLLARLGRGDLAHGRTAHKGSLPTLTWSEQCRARLAHQLIRWGTRMRRSVEKSNRAYFESIKR